MKKILLDCRYLGMSGIGRVLEGYIFASLQEKEYEFYYLGKKELLQGFSIDEKYILQDETYPVSKKGLFITKKVNSFDLFIIPNFIIPFGVKIPVFTLIHDLMFLDFEQTTNGFLDKKIKLYFYKRCIRKSKCIFTVSNFTKERIKYHFKKVKCDIKVVYNGLSQSIRNYDRTSKEKKPYLIFVGNIKKQKGLPILLDALAKVDYNLYIVGNKDNFRTKDESVLNRIRNNSKITFTGKIDDMKLYSLISEASYLIQPSLYEGFGLPPLEALYLGTKPIISDIPVFKEIYKDLDVEFFKSEDSNALAEVIQKKPNVIPEPLDSAVLQKYSFEEAFKVILGELRK